MGFQFLVATCLLAVVVGSYGHGVPEDLSFLKSIVGPYVSCNLGELACSPNCTKIQVCLGDAFEDLKTCPTDSLCDVNTFTCQKNVTECGALDKDKFECHGPVGGRYPNPYDCHSYFECPDPSITTTPAPTTPTTPTKATEPTESPEPTEPTEPTVASDSPLERSQYLDFSTRVVTVEKHDCNPKTNAYDSLSTTCRFKETHRVCVEGPTPECTKPLQAGALVENPNMYYVCVQIDGVMKTWVLKCADATAIFEGGKCVA